MRIARWLGVAAALAGCVPQNPKAQEVAPAVAAESATVTQILQELENLIAHGQDTEQDRVYAYKRAGQMDDDGSADYTFARAALAGRVAELRGIKAGALVGEVERFARLTLERDPQFQAGDARRMLASLYVMAPARLVEHGDSEDGLSMLEDLVVAAPDNLRNRLRLAQGYIHLGDPQPSFEHLCVVLPRQSQLRPDEQKLLGALMDEVGGPPALGCPTGAP